MRRIFGTHRDNLFHAGRFVGLIEATIFLSLVASLMTRGPKGREEVSKRVTDTFIRLARESLRAMNPALRSLETTVHFRDDLESIEKRMSGPTEMLIRGASPLLAR